MKRSKFEVCMDILKVVAHRGPLKVTYIMRKANINHKALNDQLDFLIEQGLVEERKDDNHHVVFVITQQGINVLKYFRELKQVLPVAEVGKQTAVVMNPVPRPKYDYGKIY
ncbi:MAG: winged helix-turn-helix domain-containing protein [Candidatus Bathyarchaeota archaeon]|nr:winged helix-turn-helix domain-containing protein [Candidatus Bathyarchaeota archaeon]